MRQADVAKGHGSQGREIPEKNHTRRTRGSLSSHRAVMPPGCWGLSLLVTQIKAELDPRLLLTHAASAAQKAIPAPGASSAATTGFWEYPGAQRTLPEGFSPPGSAQCLWVLCEHLRAFRNTSCSVQLSRNGSQKPPVNTGLAMPAEEPKPNIPLCHPLGKDQAEQRPGVSQEASKPPCLVLLFT